MQNANKKISASSKCTHSSDSFLINLPSEMNVWKDYRSGWVLSFGASLMGTLIGLERRHYGTADFSFAAD